MKKNKIKRAFSILELGFMFVALSIALAALVPLISKNVKHASKSISASDKYKTTECKTEGDKYYVSADCEMCDENKNCIDCLLKQDDCAIYNKKVNYRACVCQSVECTVENCKICNNEGKCEECNDGYKLEENKCEPDCAKKFGEGCIRCNNTECTRCKRSEGYELDNGTCHSCGKGQYYSTNNHTCKDCYYTQRNIGVDKCILMKDGCKPRGNGGNALFCTQYTKKDEFKEYLDTSEGHSTNQCYRTFNSYTGFSSIYPLSCKSGYKPAWIDTTLTRTFGDNGRTSLKYYGSEVSWNSNLTLLCIPDTVTCPYYIDKFGTLIANDLIAVTSGQDISDIFSCYNETNVVACLPADDDIAKLLEALIYEEEQP